MDWGIARDGSAAVADRIEEARDRVAALFAALMQRCAALRAGFGGVPPRLAGPLGRLAVALQAADASDQRLAHLLAMAARRGACNDLARAAVGRVMARQLAALAEALAATAEELQIEVEAVERLAPEAAPAAALAAIRAEKEGLAAVAAAIGDLGAELEAETGSGLSPETLGGADLGWVRALYTMDAEREAHARAFR